MNELSGYFEDINNTADVLKITITNSPFAVKQLNDASKDLSSSPAQNGRFENGTIILGKNPPNGFIHKECKDCVKGNGKDFIRLKNSNMSTAIFEGLWLSMQSVSDPITNQSQIVDGIKILSLQRISIKNYLIKIDNPLNINISIFNKGEIFIGGGNSCKINSVNIANNTITIETINIPITLRDDDALPDDNMMPGATLPINLLPLIIPTDLTKMTFAGAYIEPIMDEFKLNFIEYKSNTLDNDYNLFYGYSQSSTLEQENFWCCHLVAAWQADAYEDSDSDYEIDYYPLAFSIIGSLSDTQNENGMQTSIFFNEVNRDVYKADYLNKVKEEVPHEIGHQFGLNHGLTIPDGATMGVMAVYQPIPMLYFIPRHKNLIRSRINSPGTGK